MDYINKLFGQYPFIYYINGKYYAFGTDVCTNATEEAYYWNQNIKRLRKA